MKLSALSPSSAEPEHGQGLQDRAPKHHEAPLAWVHPRGSAHRLRERLQREVAQSARHVHQKKVEAHAAEDQGRDGDHAQAEVFVAHVCVEVEGRHRQLREEEDAVHHHHQQRIRHRARRHHPLQHIRTELASGALEKPRHQHEGDQRHERDVQIRRVLILHRTRILLGHISIADPLPRPALLSEGEEQHDELPHDVAVVHAEVVLQTVVEAAQARHHAVHWREASSVQVPQLLRCLGPQLHHLRVLEKALSLLCRRSLRRRSKEGSAGSVLSLLSTSTGLRSRAFSPRMPVWEHLQLLSPSSFHFAPEAAPPVASAKSTLRTGWPPPSSWVHAGALRRQCHGTGPFGCRRPWGTAARHKRSLWRGRNASSRQHGVFLKRGEVELAEYGQRDLLEKWPIEARSSIF
eukprot:scaffold2038_cov259-Pinguiococcus_pyrenoidosus.AAC.8